MEPLHYVFSICLFVLVCAVFHHSAAHPAARDTRDITAVTPPPGTPQWTIKDEKQNICMLMAMNATLSDYPEDVSIPSYATVDDVSVCNSTAAEFRLKWAVYTIYITFEVDGGSYRMKEVGGSEESFGSFSWSYSSSSFQSAPLGHCMTCNEELEADQITFHQYQFQPFAQRSNSEYGQANECSFGISMELFIVIAVVVLFLLVAGVGLCIGVVVFVRRRNNSVPYARTQ